MSSHIHSKRVVDRRKQFAVLGNFIIKQFLDNIWSSYYNVIHAERHDFVIREEDNGRVEKRKCELLFVTLLRRVNGSILQVKKVCCIVAKFLKTCQEHHLEAMKFLRNDLRKLLVGAFVVSVKNSNQDLADRVSTREAIYDQYAKATGLPVDQIINCSTIVRHVMLYQLRTQKKLHGKDNELTHRISVSSSNADEDFLNDCSNMFGLDTTDDVSITPLDCKDQDQVMSSGYITLTELEEFNEYGKKLVIKNFEVL